MSRESAKAKYTRLPGDPEVGYISPDDVMDAIDIMYDDMTNGPVVDADVAADADIDPSKIAGTALTAESTGVFSVLDYGAVGDGTTDDYDAFVAADAAAAAAGVALHIAPGTYLIGSTINAHTTWRGAGRSQTVINGVRIVYAADGMDIAGLTLNASDPYAIYAVAVDDVRLIDCTITQTGETTTNGMYVNDTARAHVTGCTFTSEGIHTVEAVDFLIEGNQFDPNYANTTECIHASRNSSGIITGNTFTRVGQSFAAIDVYSSGERCIITANRFIHTRSATVIIAKVVMDDDPGNSSAPGDLIDGVVISNNVMQDLQSPTALGRVGIFAEYYDSRETPAFSTAETHRALTITDNVLEDFTTMTGASWVGIAVTGHNSLVVNNIIRNMEKTNIACTGIAISDTVSGNAAGFTSSIGMRVAGNVISGVEGGYGINVGDVTLCQISDNVIRTDDETGHKLVYGIQLIANSTMADCQITGNIIECDDANGFGLHGHQTPAVTRTLVSGNTFKNCGARLSGPINDLVISGNSLENNSNGNAWILGGTGKASRNILFLGNHISQKDAYGVYGLLAYDIDGFSVTNNSWRDGRQGFGLLGACKNGLITGNLVLSSTVGTFPENVSVSGGDWATITISGNVVVA